MIDEKYLDRFFQVHLHLSHYGQLVIGMADTGRVYPSENEVAQDNFNTNDFPAFRSLGSKSWDTRFDEGRSCIEPRRVVVIYLRGEVDRENEMSSVVETHALVITRECKSRKVVQRRDLLSHVYPQKFSVVVNDGLGEVDLIVERLNLQSLWEKDANNIDESFAQAWKNANISGASLWDVAKENELKLETVFLLQKAAERVLDQFGQCSDFFRWTARL